VNPIRAKRERLLASLSAEERNALEAFAGERSKLASGSVFTVAELVDLALAVKYVAAVDGLSRPESNGLALSIQSHGLPEPFRTFVLEADLDSVQADHIGELFTHDPAKARYVLYGAIQIAQYDGFSAAERELALTIADRLGLPRPLVDLYAAETRLALMAFERRDSALLAAVRELRKAVLAAT
jgi:hypothetical protein